MRVLAYVRVSTDEQAEEGFSLPTQQRRIIDFCRSQWETGPELVWYVDDGYSAKDMDRPRLGALRRDAGPGDTVMVLRLDRLTRSVLDLYTLLKEWDDQGIFFRSVTEPYDTHKAEGRFMLGLLALLAEWERLRISERVREVMLNTVKADRRHLSRPPLGYDLADGQLRINPDEAALVREIFRLYAGGLGTRAVAVALNRQGLRTKQGAAWSDFAVSYVLRNPAYVGQVAWQRIQVRGKRSAGRRSSAEAVLVDGAHTAIVTPELWAATERLRSRLAGGEAGAGGGAPAPGRHPLTGLLRCGLCGAPVHGVVQRRYRNGREQAGRERRYYRCSRREHQRDCSLPYLPADVLEAKVLSALPPLAPPDRLREIAAALQGSVSSQDEQAAELKAELRRCERALRRWDEAYESEDISRGEWRERTAPIRARRKELLARVVPADTREPEPGALAEAMADLPAIWAVLAPAERKVLLHGLVREVTVSADANIRVEVR